MAAAYLQGKGVDAATVESVRKCISHDYSRLSSDLAVYTGFDRRGNIVRANRVGWGRSFGTYDFYDAQFLGSTDNLRGYRKYRFVGG